MANAVSEARRGFVGTWTLANLGALFVAYVAYTPIAHGITGGHGRDLTPAQFVAHSVGLAVVALLVGLAQRRALSRYVSIPMIRVWVLIPLFIAAFWAGYYQPFLVGPDWDIVYGFLVLGTGIWLGRVSLSRSWLAALVAILAFPIASFLGELVFFVAITASEIKPEMQTNDLQHSLFWITVAIATGIIGGGLGGWALPRLVK